MSWTDERIERLKEMWTEGSTASQIADELGGVSRNAVIGKAHRLGLESRPSPVKPGEEKEQEGRAAPPRPRPRSRGRDRSPRRSRAPSRAPATDAPRHAPAPPAAPPSRQPTPTHDPVSLGRPRRLHPPGPGRQAGADPAGPAAPPGAGQAERRGRRQDQPARPQRPHLQMADGPSGRARLPLLRQAGQPRLPLLRRALRRRLPGAAPAPRPPPAAAAAVRRPAGPLASCANLVSNPGAKCRNFSLARTIWLAHQPERKAARDCDFERSHEIAGGKIVIDQRAKAERNSLSTQGRHQRHMKAFEARTRGQAVNRNAGCREPVSPGRKSRRPAASLIVYQRQSEQIRWARKRHPVPRRKVRAAHRKRLYLRD